jgi:hypothetical protein
MNNLFIIRSPLQLLNAVEAKEYFKTDNNILVILTNSQNDEKSFEKILTLSTWDNIIYYKEKPSLFKRAKLIKSLKKHTYHYVFTGDYGSINQAFLANLNAKEFYLIDDGTRTIVIHKMLKNPSQIPFSQKTNLYRYALLGLKVSFKKPLNFFTCYNLEPLKNSKLIINEYRYLQSLFQPNQQDDAIYFLGQNIDDLLMKKGRYVEYIKRLKECYKKTIYYLPHRHETISNELQELFDEQLILIENKIPIEIFFLEKNIYPRYIISFTSSALFNLSRIYRTHTTINALTIHPDDIKGVKNHHFIQKCYRMFKDYQIDRIDLF